MSELIQVFQPNEVLALDERLARSVAQRQGRYTRAELQQPSASLMPMVKQPRRIGLIEIAGFIASSRSWWGTSSTSIRQQARAFREAARIDAVLLLIDSPGGSATGVEDAFVEILKTRRVKPVAAAVAGTAASAAYWLAAAAGEISILRGGEAGSIGVWMMHVDQSRALDGAGLTVTLVSSTPEKVERNSFEPLSDPARQDMVRAVGSVYRSFVDSVAEGRGVAASRVRADFGRGRVLLAGDAVRDGLVDYIATPEDVLERAMDPAAALERRSRAFEARAQMDRAIALGCSRRLALEVCARTVSTGPGAVTMLRNAYDRDPSPENRRALLAAAARAGSARRRDVRPWRGSAA